MCNGRLGKNSHSCELVDQEGFAGSENSYFFQSTFKFKLLILSGDFELDIMNNFTVF